jgi:membrane dipeptidase
MSRAWWDETHRLRAAHPDDPAAVARGIDAWEQEQPQGSVTASEVADHIDHIRAVAGIEAIGLGGDYDGVPSMGDELADVAAYPLVFQELRARGYTDEDLRAIAGRNVLRVIRAAEDIARQLGSRPPSMATIEALDGSTATTSA